MPPGLYLGVMPIFSHSTQLCQLKNGWMAQLVKQIDDPGSILGTHMAEGETKFSFKLSPDSHRHAMACTLHTRMSIVMAAIDLELKQRKYF